MSGRPARNVIRITAAVALNDRGEVLLVRKAGTSAFMLPGGKPAVGEDDRATLAREIREELGCAAQVAEAKFLGAFRAFAANEPGHLVEANLYAVQLCGVPEPRSEIAELRWLHPDASLKPTLAPLAEFHVLPLVQAASRRRSGPRPRTILFVCKGNWFRSQMAAAIYNHFSGGGLAQSAGTHVGAPDEPEGQLLADLFPTADFFETLEARGMYVRANTTRKLKPSDLDDYELVVSMAEEPYVPAFLRNCPTAIWWEVENPPIVDRAKAEEIYAQVSDLVRDLIWGS